MGPRPGAPEPIQARHSLSPFDCGVPPFDEWLERRAMRSEIDGASRTFVSLKADRVVGYYSLTPVSILHTIARSRAPRTRLGATPAISISRLAIDKSAQGNGLAATLLRDCVLRFATAARTISAGVLIVPAVSNGVRVFCEGFGFRKAPLEPAMLMITLEEVRRLVDD